jgi:hypothetical protein
MTAPRLARYVVASELPDTDPTKRATCELWAAFRPIALKYGPGPAMNALASCFTEAANFTPDSRAHVIASLDAVKAAIARPEYLRACAQTVKGHA